VRSWSPGVYDADDDYQRMLWHWIKDNVAGDNPVPIYLGYGTEDEFATANALLAELLPEDRVVIHPGGSRLCDLQGPVGAVFWRVGFIYHELQGHGMPCPCNS
jgi:hypothetical protein